MRLIHTLSLAAGAGLNVGFNVLPRDTSANVGDGSWNKVPHPLEQRVYIKTENGKHVAVTCVQIGTCATKCAH